MRVLSAICYATACAAYVVTTPVAVVEGCVAGSRTCSQAEKMVELNNMFSRVFVGRAKHSLSRANAITVCSACDLNLMSRTEMLRCNYDLSSASLQELCIDYLSIRPIMEVGIVKKNLCGCN